MASERVSRVEVKQACKKGTCSRGGRCCCAATGRMLPRARWWPGRKLLRRPTSPGAPAGNSFDANVVMILAVLLCALICALGLNSIVRCALRCSTRMPAPSGARRRQQAAGGGGGPVCAICLGELEPGERVRVLPKCNHGFHVRCVDRWLLALSTCPTCRQSLFAAPPKGSGCADAGAAGAEPPVRAFLVPLRPEGFVTPYDF